MEMNCPFISTATKLEEVTQKTLVHVQEAHNKDFNNMKRAEEIQRMLLALERSMRVVNPTTCMWNLHSTDFIQGYMINNFIKFIVL